MLKTSKIIIISLSSVYISACSIDGTTSNFSNYGHSGYTNSQMIYPDSYDSYNYQYQYQNQSGEYQSGAPSSSGKIVVPESYHVGTSGRPPSAKDMDKNWVRKQNPSSYTIELANDAKPSRVAGVLYKAPKNERTAEVKTTNGNYTGVYGTYPSYEAAKEKLMSLPENVRKDANIKSWGSVQSNVDE